MSSCWGPVDVCDEQVLDGGGRAHPEGEAAVDAIDRFYMTAPLPLGLAVHEAGHAVGRWWCGLGLRVVAALPDGTGITANVRGPVHDVSQARTPSEFMRLAVATYAGGIAEAMVTGFANGQRHDEAVGDAKRVDQAARHLFDGDDVARALLAARKTAVLVFEQPRVLAMTMAIVGLLVQRRVLSGGTVVSLLDDTIAQMYPWQQRDAMLVLDRR